MTTADLESFRAIVRWSVASYLAAMIVTLGLGLDPAISLLS
jgi:hypothetical protein